MKNLFIILFFSSSFSFSQSPIGEGKVAYRWVYTIDEDTKKFVPTALRLFDHAYSNNMKYLFSCITQMSELKYGTLAAVSTCMKPIANSLSGLAIESASFQNSFSGTGLERELKIEILNRPTGFNKLIGCLAGRAKYKRPNLETEILTDCTDEIKNGKSQSELTELNQIPYAVSSAEKAAARGENSKATRILDGFLETLRNAKHSIVRTTPDVLASIKKYT